MDRALRRGEPEVDARLAQGGVEPSVDGGNAMVGELDDSLRREAATGERAEDARRTSEREEEANAERGEPSPKNELIRDECTAGTDAGGKVRARRTRGAP